MKRIVSIQSHVAYGYVGNRAAMFPLQLMGHDVVAVNTVQFSNHTGYGSWTGDIFSADHIMRLLQGLEARGVFDTSDAVLSGYLGDPTLGDIVVDMVGKIRARRPNLVWACDPVMGDVGRGFFVKDGIPHFFRHNALPHATILTPNQFELAALTGRHISSLGDSLQACSELLDQGPKTILVTSLQVDSTPPDMIQMLAVTRDERLLVSTPMIPLDPAPNGAGDATAAIFLGNMLTGGALKEALSATAAAIYAVFEATQAAETRELALVQAQDAIRTPKRAVPVQAL